MKPEDFVYNQIYRGALNAGARDRQALNNAILGLEDYKRHKIAKKVSGLIEARVKLAVKESKRIKT